MGRAELVTTSPHSGITTREVEAYLAASTRPAGKCLGTIGNDLTGHFGAYPKLYYSAKTAADSLGADLHTDECPSVSHFDFYDYVEGEVNYGHVDLHVPAVGLHYANSSRCTRWLNAGRTVGTYPSWGARRGWSYHPGLGNDLPIILAAVAPTPPPPSHGGHATMPTRAQWVIIQHGLRKRGRYAGPLDGIPGANTWKGVQLTARAGGGYVGPIDGVPGLQTYLAVQRYAKAWGAYAGPIDGIPGPRTWAGFVKGVKA